MRKLLTTLAIIVLLPVSSAVFSAEKLVFVTSQWWPPYKFVENGQIIGAHVDTLREVCKRLGYEVEIQLLPWARALQYATQGYDVQGKQVDGIFSFLKTEERTQSFYYPIESLGSVKSVLVAPKGSNITVSSLNDLKGKTIGVVRGYSYTPEFDNDKTLAKQVAKDNTQLLNMLFKKRTDLVAGEEEPLKFVAKQLGQEIETLYVLSESPYYTAFSKKALGDERKVLIEKFSQTLRQLKEEGVIQKIEEKYFQMSRN